MSAAAKKSKPKANTAIAISGHRIILLLAALILALGAVGTKTLWLQTVQQQNLSKRAQGQQQDVRVLPAMRGNIVDRNGRILALSESAVTFAADPTLIKDPAGVALKIAEVLNWKKSQTEDLIQRLTEGKQSKQRFTYVVRQIDRAQADKVKDLDIVGIYGYDENRRMYPNGSVAGQLIGAVNIDGQGIDGLESLYDHSMTGAAGTQLVVRDPSGVPIDVLKLRREHNGENVQLTLDLRIQQQAEQILAQTVAQTGADSATAIVMNPRTGEILTTANVPKANPAAWGKTPPLNRKNRAVTDTYEPGSTLKVVALSGALEEGKVTPQSEFVVPPQLRFCQDDKTCVVKEAHSRGTERMSVKRILVESSNIGTIMIAKDQLGKRGFDQWVRKFGFGRLTGIDFPGEVQGYLTPLNQWSDVSIGNIPIGQGISVTPIQLISAYSAIANDGVLIKPHLVKKVGKDQGATESSRRILSTATARTMRGMFEGVVRDDRGTGTAARIEGYAVGGKTGTAEIATSGGYLKGRYNASFVGFVPVQNPKLVTLVVVNDTSMYGGQAAAPAFEAITELALRVLAIPPDGRT